MGVREAEWDRGQERTKMARDKPRHQERDCGRVRGRSEGRRVFWVEVGMAVLPKGLGALPKPDARVEEPKTMSHGCKAPGRMGCWWRSGKGPPRWKRIPLRGRQTGDLRKEGRMQAAVGCTGRGSKVRTWGRSEAPPPPPVPGAERDQGYQVPRGCPLTIRVQLGLPAGPAP